VSKRDWKPGTYQLGMFLRLPNGGTIEMVSGPDGEREENVEAALAIYKGKFIK